MISKPNGASAGSISNRDMFISILIVGGFFFIFGFAKWINATAQKQR